MNIIDTILRILVILSFITIKMYWRNAERAANARLPSTVTKRTRFRNRFRIIEIAFYIILLLQLIGVPLLPFTPNAFTRIAGILLILGGAVISVEGRTDLGHNWNHMIDYQVKQRQQLVTDGIYRYVRHPIYAGFVFMLTGVEIVMGSWLFLAFFAVTSAVVYLQSKKEESILARHFAKEYLQYMHHSKMFIPYIF